jgi:ABC-type sugar transport system ATPase subunit
MLAAQAITKRYGAVTALDGVSVEVRRGEIVGLAGENGSGKSTLCRVLAGAVIPDEGTLTLDGDPCSFARPRDALDRGVVLVSQEPTAVPDMSIAENLFLHEVRATWRPVRRRRLAGRARPLLARVGVSADPTLPVSALRAGDRELVEIAKALASAPALLLLDEVTSRLGRDGVARLFGLVRSLRAEGTAVVFVTHRLREIRELADRVVVLRDGRQSAELPAPAATDEALASAMVGRDLGDFFHKREVEHGGVALRVSGLVVAGTSSPVDLEVRRGEIVGLAGLVGCGRSELLETLAGGRRALSGHVEVDGRRVSPGSVRAALDAGIALVPEDRHRQGLVLHGTVRANLAIGSHRAAAIARRRDEARMSQHAIDRLRIRARGPEATVAELSGGNQQKVVLARVLARRPRVLLLDEPTRGIDVGAKAELFELLGTLVESGMAVLLASSDLLELLGLCDRIVVLHDRAVSGELDRAQASEQAIALLSAGGGLARAG